MTDAYFVWDSDEYSVGDETLDGQHKRLLSVLNRLYALVHKGDSAIDMTGASAMMDELTHYIVEHFAYEEQRMLESAYPLTELQRHRSEHIGFVETIRGFEQRIQDGDRTALSDMLPYLYGDWLIQHICGSDMAYRSYIQPHPAGDLPPPG